MSTRHGGTEWPVAPIGQGSSRFRCVSFGIQLFSATESVSGVAFHQLDRATGQRIRHLNVKEDDRQPVENAEIVKGYEYSKGKYLVIEPNEIARVRIPTKNVIDVQQFVNLSDLPRPCLRNPISSLPSPNKPRKRLPWCAAP